MSRFEYDDYLGSFEHPSEPCDLGPPEQIAFYSCFINDDNDYRFNDHSALRRYKGRELRPPLQLDAVVGRGEFHAASARLDEVPRPSLVPIIAACVGSKGAASVRDADVITRRGALSRYWAVLYLPNLRLVVMRFQFRHRRKHDVRRYVRERETTHGQEEFRAHLRSPARVRFAVVLRLRPFSDLWNSGPYFG